MGVSAMDDITFSIVGEEYVFKANTPKGRMWMGSPEIVMPLEDGKAYRESAANAGLIVKAFP